MAGLTREQRAERASREQDLRIADPIHENHDSWDDDYLLDTKMIPAREGYTQRWVRTSLNGHEDQSNVFKKMNKGWRPRPMDTIPQGQYVMHVDFNGMNVIGIHGMILMERPLALHLRQRESIRQQTKLLDDSVKYNLYRDYENDKTARGYIGRPEFDSSSEVKRGRIAPIDDD